MKAILASSAALLLASTASAVDFSITTPNVGTLWKDGTGRIQWITDVDGNSTQSAEFILMRCNGNCDNGLTVSTLGSFPLGSRAADVTYNPSEVANAKDYFLKVNIEGQLKYSAQFCIGECVDGPAVKSGGEKVGMTAAMGALAVLLGVGSMFF